MTKMTLWEHIRTRDERDEQARQLAAMKNPLNLILGKYVEFDVLDYRSIDFHVDKILSQKRKFGREEFYLAEYVLGAPGGGKSVRLRATAATGPYLLLQEFDSFPFSEEFQGVIAECAEKRQFQIDDENALFFRKVSEPFECVVTDLTNLASGLGGLTYWDFARETKDEAGFSMNEHFIVERRESDGWFTMLRGIEVLPHQVTIL